MLTKVKYFGLGVLTTIVVLMGVFMYNTVSVRTETTYTYNPAGITRMFGSYAEVTK